MAFKSRNKCFPKRGIHAGIISKKERKGGDLCQAMGNRVVLEFGRGEEFRPLVRVVCTKDPEISFDFLISSFSLSICLGVISCGEVDIIFENSSKFSSEG